MIELTCFSPLLSEDDNLKVVAILNNLTEERLNNIRKASAISIDFDLPMLSKITTWLKYNLLYSSFPAKTKETEIESTHVIFRTFREIYKVVIDKNISEDDINPLLRGMFSVN